MMDARELARRIVEVVERGEGELEQSSVITRDTLTLARALLAATEVSARDAIIEECAQTLEALSVSTEIAHWSDDEHDGVILSAAEIRTLKSTYVRGHQ